ncbi:MAG: DUF308 domain-containing protein [Gemmobacter sp.]|nr:DUF308 domain-containing protein [Gemmobacter sp.]
MQDLPPVISDRFLRALKVAGAVFIGLGLLAIALPAAMTLALELLIAVLLLGWGAAGLVFSLMLRPVRGWVSAALFFALVFALGAVFIAAPQAGIATLTLLLIGVFAVEGVSQVVIGLQMRERVAGWGWIVFSGVSSLTLGALVIAGWPASAAWVLGLLAGLNFLSTGITLIMVAAGLTSVRRA